MSGDNLKLSSFVETTVCLKWEITKEDFDNCEFPNKLDSPKYAVQIGSEKSEWQIGLHPRGDCDMGRDDVAIFLKLLSQNQTYEVCYSMGVKTADGYWPDGDFLGALEEKHFSTFSDSDEKFQRHPSSTTQTFSQQFVENKITLVAHLVFDMEGENSPSPMEIALDMEGDNRPTPKEIANDFMGDFQDTSSLESLSDFTIISRGKRFPCHKVFLAARSKYFEALFRIDQKQELIIDFATPEIVEAILDFMSKGLIPSDIDDKAMDLIPLADMYGLDLLTKACQVSLVKNLSLENVLETFVIADKHVRTDEIRQKILAFIKKESLQIVKTENWKEFVQNYPGLVTEIVIAMSSK